MERTIGNMDMSFDIVDMRAIWMMFIVLLFFDNRDVDNNHHNKH
jgi:hypothetical protein